jgi:hypothetical protein
MKIMNYFYALISHHKERYQTIDNHESFSLRCPETKRKFFSVLSVALGEYKTHMFLLKYPAIFFAYAT